MRDDVHGSWPDRSARSGSRLAEAEAPDGQPGPGDLFVLRETAAFPVEWAVLERDATTPSRILVVPADTQPLAGSTDVRVSPRAGAGPLTVRCSPTVWVDARMIAGHVRSGALEPGDLERIQLRREALLEGRQAGTPLDRETDSDPEYRDWIGETVLPAARVLEQASAAWRRRHPAARMSPVSPPMRWTSLRPLIAGRWARDLVWPGLAAALAVVSIGLSWTCLSLREQVLRLTRPLINPPTVELQLVAIRGAETTIPLHVPPGDDPLTLSIRLGSEVPVGVPARFEVQDLHGRVLWTESGFSIPDSHEFKVRLPRWLLAERGYRYVLYPGGKGAADAPLKVRVELER